MEPLEKYLRPEVAAFARLMEKRLRENDHKPGWKGDDPEDLFERVHDETCELADELEAIPRRPGAIGKESADAANMLMMVADVCGALEE